MAQESNGRKTQAGRRLIVSMLIRAASELMPVPGLVAAALIFPEGIHSSHPTAYLVLALVSNFLLVAGSAYYVITTISRYLRGV